MHRLLVAVRTAIVTTVTIAAAALRTVTATALLTEAAATSASAPAVTSAVTSAVPITIRAFATRSGLTRIIEAGSFRLTRSSLIIESHITIGISRRRVPLVVSGLHVAVRIARRCIAIVEPRLSVAILETRLRIAVVESGLCIAIAISATGCTRLIGIEGCPFGTVTAVTTVVEATSVVEATVIATATTSATSLVMPVSFVPHATTIGTALRSVTDGRITVSPCIVVLDSFLRMPTTIIVRILIGIFIGVLVGIPARRYVAVLGDRRTTTSATRRRFGRSGSRRRMHRDRFIGDGIGIAFDDDDEFPAELVLLEVRVEFFQSTIVMRLVRHRQVTADIRRT